MPTIVRYVVCVISSQSVVLRSIASVSLGNLLEKQFLRPDFDLLTQKFSKWDPEICVLTSSLGNFVVS